MLQRRRARVQVGVTGKETALSRSQRRSHSVSAPRFFCDQAWSNWDSVTSATVPSCTHVLHIAHVGSILWANESEHPVWGILVTILPRTSWTKLDSMPVQDPGNPQLAAVVHYVPKRNKHFGTVLDEQPQIFHFVDIGGRSIFALENCLCVRRQIFWRTGQNTTRSQVLPFSLAFNLSFSEWQCETRGFQATLAERWAGCASFRWAVYFLCEWDYKIVEKLFHSSILCPHISRTLTIPWFSFTLWWAYREENFSACLRC